MSSSMVSGVTMVRDRPGVYDHLLQVSPEQLITRIHQGLRFAELDTLRDRLGLSARAMSSLINIPERTLVRRRQSGRLSSVESERVLRLERLFALVAGMLRDDDAVQRWLNAPKKALAGKTPLQYAETEVGAREVENLIGRLRHGVFV